MNVEAENVLSNQSRMELMFSSVHWNGSWDGRGGIGCLDGHEHFDVSAAANSAKSMQSFSGVRIRTSPTDGNDAGIIPRSSMVSYDR